MKFLAQGILLLLIFSGVLPSGASWFESSMSMHMLVQIPLLIVLGALSFQPDRSLSGALSRIDPLGAIAFICFTAWMLFWMLPINLDLATIDPTVRILKLISIPIGIGAAFRWLWHKANTLFKCVVIFEIWASITRLGWLYIKSPEQLCSSYLIGEQVHVGNTLLSISAISALFLILYSVFGAFSDNPGKNQPT